MDARISRSLRLGSGTQTLRIEFHPEVGVDRSVCTDLLFSMLTSDELSYRIALTLTKGIGPVIARKLLSLMGSAQAIFSDRERFLQTVGSVSHKLLDALYDPDLIPRAKEIATWVNKQNIGMYGIDQSDYPSLLSQCADAPFLLYSKGRSDLFERKHILAVVGTRNISPYGRECCKQIIRGLAQTLPDLVIVSGLAYGVDVEAHKNALDNGLDTVAVLAHGLDRIYPYTHRDVARAIVGQGCLVTEYPCKTNPDRYNFVSRNRIIAGLSHATLIVESSEKGGSLITAKLSTEYNRETLAVPGRISDKYSSGCNALIANSEATCVTGATDILDYLNWGGKQVNKVCKKEKPALPSDPDSAKIVELLYQKGPMQVDQLGAILGISPAPLLNTLFELEFEGYVNSLPGGIYDLC